MQLYEYVSPTSALGLLLLVGYCCGLVAGRFKLPAIIGYLVAGVLLGQSGLEIISEAELAKLEFITSISLGCIAFIIGSELQISSLKRMGRGLWAIILAESFFAFATVFAGIFLVTHNLVLSILFGAMAPASAPAGTVAVIQEFRASGTLTRALYAVVGFDDALAVLIFGFALAVAKVLLSTGQSFETLNLLTSLWQPLREVGLSMILGGGLGYIFTLLVRNTTKAPEQLVIIFWAILSGVGLAGSWHLSPILVCMVIGILFVNMSPNNQVLSVRNPLQQLMGLIFVLFFGLAGIHLNLALLTTLGTVGAVYIITRIVGLLSGAWFGAYLFDMESKIRHYLGLGILSQAGVAIGFALLIQHELSDIPGASMLGARVLSIITATSILFELIGPLAAWYALNKAGEIRGKE